MRMRKIVAIILVVFLSGCATPYQPAGFAGGFAEVQLDNDVWRVSFKGNGYTDLDRVEELVMLRSAEIALANGFTHFAFSSAKTDKNIGTINREIITEPSANSIVVMFNDRPKVNAMVYEAKFICESVGKKYKVTCNSPKK
jgi:hypothetical protein